MDFNPRSRKAVYAFVQRTLARFGYARLGKTDKGACTSSIGIPDSSAWPLRASS